MIATDLPSVTRYRVVAATVALAGVTYLDRVCIGVLAPSIMTDLRITPIQMSFVFSAFAAAYALFEMPTAWWADRVGGRRVLTRIVLWWSAFTMLTAAATSYAAMLAVRFLFGVGRSGSLAQRRARVFALDSPAGTRARARSILRRRASGGRIDPRIGRADGSVPALADGLCRLGIRGIGVGRVLVSVVSRRAARASFGERRGGRSHRENARSASRARAPWDVERSLPDPQPGSSLPSVRGEQLRILLLHHLAADVSGESSRHVVGRAGDFLRASADAERHRRCDRRIHHRRTMPPLRCSQRNPRDRLCGLCIRGRGDAGRHAGVRIRASAER